MTKKTTANRCLLLIVSGCIYISKSKNAHKTMNVRQLPEVSKREKGKSLTKPLTEVIPREKSFIIKAIPLERIGVGEKIIRIIPRIT